jgi:phosphatidylinositol alpha-1,6-mannosyltransferase
MPGSRPKRVLFLLTEVFANGGIQRFNKTLLAAAGQHDVACRVLTLNDPATDQVPEFCPNATVRGFAGDRKRFAAAATRSLWFDRHDHVLVGHINFMSLVIGALSLRLSSARTVMLVAHGIEVWSGIGRLRRYSLARAGKILCVSRYTRQRILEQAPSLDPARLAVFPNALSEIWRGTSGREVTRPLPQRFIMSVTRLERGDRYKGIVTVIEALSMLADDSMHYCVVGHGDDLAFLRSVAGRTGVQHRVHFLRGVSDAELITLYGRCAAFVLPSGMEGFGIVFLEAMYFGAPVIAAAEKGALDVVQDGETGLMVRFGDAVALKEAIERLQRDLGLRERVIGRGRALVTEGGPFTFSRFAQRYGEALGVCGPGVP